MSKTPDADNSPTGATGASEHKRTIKRYLAQQRTGVVRDVRGVVTHEDWRCHVEYVDGATELTHERRRVEPRLDRYEPTSAPHSVFTGWSRGRGKSKQGRQSGKERGRGRER